MAKSKGSRNKKREYLNDYKINENGKYEYQGTRYRWKLEETERKKAVLKLGIMGPAAFVCIILAGCVPAPGVSHWPFLLIAYVASAAAAVSLWVAAWRLCSEKNPMRGYVYENSVGKLPGRSMLTVILAAAAIAGQVSYLIKYGFEDRYMGALLFIILEGMAMADAWQFYRKIRSLEWEKCEKG